jgi:hypothetical protein
MGSTAGGVTSLVAVLGRQPGVEPGSHSKLPTAENVTNRGASWPIAKLSAGVCRTRFTRVMTTDPVLLLPSKAHA